MQYVWSPVYVDAMIAREWDYDANGSLETRHYAQQDANWNVTAVISTAGTVAERKVQTPYGAQTILDGSWSAIGSSTVAWVHGYQGKRYEATVAANDFNHRWFSPSLGRFVTIDPISFAGGYTSLYVFVGNDPLAYVDPLGLVSVRRTFNLDEHTRISITFEGFSPENRRRFQQDYIRAYRALGWAWYDVYSLINDDVTPQAEARILNGLNRWFCGGVRPQIAGGNGTDCCLTWANIKYIEKILSAVHNGMAQRPPLVEEMANPDPNYPNARMLASARFTRIRIVPTDNPDQHYWQLSPEERSTGIIHEASHIYAGTKDHGYVADDDSNPPTYSKYNRETNSRVITVLNKQQLLENADTYAHYIYVNYIR